MSARRWAVSAALLLMIAVFAAAAWTMWSSLVAWLCLGAAALTATALADVASTASHLRYELQGDHLTIRRSRFGRLWRYRGSGRDVLRLSARRMADTDFGPRQYTVHLIADTPGRTIDFQLTAVGSEEAAAEAETDMWRTRLGLLP